MADNSIKQCISEFSLIFTLQYSTDREIAQNNNSSIIDKYVLLQLIFYYEYKRQCKNKMFNTVVSQVFLC